MIWLEASQQIWIVIVTWVIQFFKRSAFHKNFDFCCYIPRNPDTSSKFCITVWKYHMQSSSRVPPLHIPHQTSKVNRDDGHVVWTVGKTTCNPIAWITWRDHTFGLIWWVLLMMTDNTADNLFNLEEEQPWKPNHEWLQTHIFFTVTQSISRAKLTWRWVDTMINFIIQLNGRLERDVWVEL